jgi:glucose-6-phosphate-specific signal transduction histidine kinase
LYKKKEMNIQNLNPQELEQLQTLLNKMNPQPQLDINPVEQMIEDIMNEFDFKQVQSVNGLFRLEMAW